MSDDFLLPGAGPWARRLRETIRRRRTADDLVYQMADEPRPDDVSPADAEQICMRSPGDRLAHLRLRKGLTMDNAAALTGISKSELSRLETGQRKIKDWHIATLASAYGLPENCLRYILAFSHAFMPDVFDSRIIDMRQSYDMKCFYTSELITRELAPEPAQISLAIPMRFSPDAYCVTFDTPYSGSLLPVGSLIVVDPHQRALMGDLVLNRISWNPLILSLISTPSGLAGQGNTGCVNFGPDIAIEDLHKVVAIVTSADVIVVKS